MRVKQLFATGLNLQVYEKIPFIVIKMILSKYWANKE